MIDHVDGKATLLALHDGRWKELLTDPPMQPFACAVADLKTCIKPLDVFHHGAVEIGHARLQAVGHREFVRKHEEFIGQG